MPVKIRLQRHGKKGKPFYWVVAADSRAKRDGKFLEKLGTYNPNTNPATITLNVDNSVKWLQNGAQPTDTAKAILSYKGVLMKKHLLGGVKKGAFTEDQAEEKFNAWLEEKEKAIAKKTEGLTKAKDAAKAEALKAEKEVNEKRALAQAEAELPETSEEEVAEGPIEVIENAEAAPEEAAAATEAVEEAKEAVEETVAAAEDTVAENAEATEEVAEAVKEKVEEAPEAQTEDSDPEKK
ncbi:MAG: 30S ribosomal protein S16 [Bacteroidota bacterium]